MFSLKRKGDYRLQLTRTLTTPGRYTIELYLFTPHDTSLPTRVFSEQQFFFSALGHSFRLLGLPDKDRVSRFDNSFALLSPYYEVMYGSALFQYRSSIDRLRQQIESSGLSAEPVKRALRLGQNFALRLRKSTPGQSRQQRYFELADAYYSWHTEQFFLECMTLKGFTDLDQDLRDSIYAFLRQEGQYRRKREYMTSLDDSPTRVWNRMSLYHRLLEYPLLLRSKVIELGAGTRKVVKAVSTMWIMMLFTYILFNARDASQQLSLTLLLGIALIYAVRDLLREDMINVITSWLRKGKPRWKIRLLTPYTNKLLALQRVWLDYRKLPELPQPVRDRSAKWVSNEERQILCYRSVLTLDKTAVNKDHIQERLSVDFEALCKLIQPASNKVFVWPGEENPSSPVQAHSIENQHDYDLLLVVTEPGQTQSSAQRWRLRLERVEIAQCKSRKPYWPSVEKQPSKTSLQRLREKIRWR